MSQPNPNFITTQELQAFWDETLLLAGKIQLAYDNVFVRFIWSEAYTYDYIIEEVFQWVNGLHPYLLRNVETVLTGTGDTGDIGVVIESVINQSTQIIVETINAQTEYLTQLIGDALTPILEEILGAVNVNQSIGRQILFQLSAQNDLITYTADNLADNVLNNTAFMLDSAVSQLASYEQQSTNSVISSINSGTSQVLQAINQLAPVSGGVGDIFVTVDNSDLSSIQSSMLQLFSQFLNSFNAKQWTINNDYTINNTIENTGSTGGSTGGADSSAGLPFDIGTITLNALGLLTAEQLAGQYQTSLNAGDILLKAGRNEYTSLEEFFNDLNNAGIGGNVVSLLYNVANAVTMILGLAWSGSQPYRNNFETLNRTDALDGLIPASQILELQMRDLATPEQLSELWSKSGFKQEYINLLYDSRTIQLQEYFLKEMYMRDIIDEETYDYGMIRLGYRPDDLRYIKKSYENIPNIPDLVRFMIRDVYNEALVNEFGLDEEYDLIQEQFEGDLRKQGISPDYAKYYYRANWVYPSPTMAYGMLHRKLITPEQLEGLLKASDYPPFWRDRLIAMSYSPYTRVDIRRMYKDGVLTPQEVQKEYEWLGYDEEHASNLTEWTVNNFSNEDETELSKLSLSILVKAWLNGFISDVEFSDYLSAKGYNSDEISLLQELYQHAQYNEVQGDVTRDNRLRLIRNLSNGYIKGLLSLDYIRGMFSTIGYPENKIDDEIKYLDYERDLLIHAETTDAIEKRFKSYIIDINQARDNLITSGYSLDETTKILELWNRDREDRNKEPTMSQLQGWLDKGIIDSNKFSTILKGMGYPDEYINYYIEDSL